MRSQIQPGAIRTQKRIIKIFRVTKNFMPIVKKYTFRGFKMELEVFFAFIL
jgi:hypothetical protein